MEQVINYGLKTFSPKTREFFQRYSSTGRLSVSLETGDNGFEKFKFNFQTLSATGEGNKKKQTASVQYYLDVDVALAEIYALVTAASFTDSVKKDLLGGLTAAKAGKSKAGKVFFTKNGGTMPERTKNRNGNAEYRSITLARSNYNDKNITGDEKAQKRAKEPKFVLSATKCDGRVYAPANSAQKLIIAIKGTDGKLQNATTIMMPLTLADVRALALMMYVEYSAYRSAQYTLAPGLTMSAAEVKKETSAVTNPQQVDKKGEVVATAPTKPEDVVVDDEVDFDFE